MGSITSCPDCPKQNCASELEAYLANSQGISYITTPQKRKVFLALHKKVGCSGDVYVVDPQRVRPSDTILNALVHSTQLFIPLANDLIKEVNRTQNGLLTNTNSDTKLPCYGKYGFQEGDERSYDNNTACCEVTYGYMKEHLRMEPTADTKKDNKTAWRSMAKSHHPDKTGTNNDDVFKKLNNLKETCSYR